MVGCTQRREGAKDGCFGLLHRDEWSKRVTQRGLAWLMDVARRDAEIDGCFGLLHRDEWSKRVTQRGFAALMDVARREAENMEKRELE